MPETIEALRQAGIQVWVVTGDKQETAINIGYSCRLIHQRDEVITLNSETKVRFCVFSVCRSIKEQSQIAKGVFYSFIAAVLI